MWLKKVMGVSLGMYYQTGWRGSISHRNKTSVRTYAEAAAAASKSGGDGKAAGGVAGRPPVITKEYKAAWKKIAPLYEVHKTPTDFMDDRPGPATTLPTKLTVNFVLPYESKLVAAEVDMVIVPANTGMMGILPGHVPTIAQLIPGLLSVHNGTEITKFFISGGFAFVHATSVTDIACTEAVPLENLDIQAAHQGVAEYTQKLNTATTDIEKAEAQIAMEVYGTLVSTLGNP